MPRFAANLTLMFNEWDFLDRFQAAADAGFTAVEFLFPYAFAPDVVAEKLARAGLEIALFNLPPGNWEAGDRGMAANPARAEEFMQSLAQALPYAKATGVKRLHVMSGHGSRGDAAMLSAFKDAIGRACETFGPLGIDVLIEPLNGRDMPGYFVNDFGFAADLIAALGLPNLKLQYDIYHRQILHGDVIRSLGEMMPIIGHIQTAAVPKRNEPGTGELDDPRIFAELDALGYQGYVGCEYRPAAGTLAGLGWFRRS